MKLFRYIRQKLKKLLIAIRPIYSFGENHITFGKPEMIILDA